jgi:hypothetical protein
MYIIIVLCNFRIVILLSRTAWRVFQSNENVCSVLSIRSIENFTPYRSPVDKNEHQTYAFFVESIKILFQH